MFVGTIAQLFEEHLYLTESESLSEYEKGFVKRVTTRNASQKEIKTALALLSRLMQALYSKPVILLIDEYDVPLAKASEKGYYREMLDVVRSMMQVLKDNNALKFVVVTGRLRIAKESIITGTNNLVSDTISDTRGASTSALRKPRWISSFKTLGLQTMRRT